MLIEAVVANKVWIGAGAFLILFTAERLAPAAPATPNPRRLFRNGALWVLLLLTSPAIVLPLTSVASNYQLWARPTAPAAATLLADVILLDIWTYLIHRAYHEIALMRRFHRVHHLDEHLDTTSAVRFHPGEVALSATLRMAPIVLLAIPFLNVVVFETALLAATLFHHSNVRFPAKFENLMSMIVVTPSIHWVHHHAVAADTNSNYSAIFSVWDRLFGTWSGAKRSPDMKIGIENVADKSLIGLLLAPFQPREK